MDDGVPVMNGGAVVNHCPGEDLHTRLTVRGALRDEGNSLAWQLTEDGGSTVAQRWGP
jgi:hypothetical protein